MDYSLYDAAKAGFSKAVFVINRAIEPDFHELIGKRAERMMPVSYVCQDMPGNRTKPYGTGHAVLCCQGVVSTPFAVINADDYYDREAFSLIAAHLKTSADYAMVGFYLRNTLSEHGTVARGICRVEDSYLTGVTEHTGIAKSNNFPPDAIASMNLWGLHPDVFAVMASQFQTFLHTTPNPDRDEFYLPSVIDRMLHAGAVRVRVFISPDKWYGITYREDKETVKAALVRMAKEGKYEGIQGRAIA
ncbi:MAG: nucleotidyltransferase [Oscillospiraceae bacterium]|nr:nucleotidyltransferase [Oscillospiraceae bacterium]